MMDRHGRETDLNVNLNVNLNITVRFLPPKREGAITAILTIGGNLMPGTITVDTANETANVNFVDDKGDTNAAAPDGIIIAFTSDNPAVATITADPSNPLQGNITPVAEGTANIGVTFTGADGTPFLEPDGVTPFTAAPAVLTVTAGAAVGADLTLSA